MTTVGRSQPARAATGDSVVLAWNQQLLDTIRETRTAPTIAARALAVVHTVIYDAWAAYDPVAVDTRQRLRANSDLRQPAAERTLENKDKAVSFAAYAALVDLFPARQASYAQQMADLGFAIDGSDPSTAAMIGAAALLRRCWTFATTTGPTSSATATGAPPTPTTPATSRSTPGTRSTTPTAGSPCASRCRHLGPPSAPGGSRCVSDPVLGQGHPFA